MSPFLKIGLISAHFHSEGILPSIKLCSKRAFRGEARDFEEFFNYLGCMLAGPGDLLGFRLFRAFSISATVIKQLSREPST